jgi:hypothetical protein
VPALGSVHYENYGVYFRHGFGTPYETFFLLMAGDCHGHFELESDQMAYTLYAKGQPIHLHFANGYFPMLNRPWLRNRVSIDHMFEKSERNPTAVLATAFTPEAEYVRASRQIDLIRPLEGEVPTTKPNGQWDEEEAKNWTAFPEWQQIPMTVWVRQVVFVKDADPKGPNYFVLRDDFGGIPTRPTDLNLWFLSTEFQREADTFHFTGQCEVDMDVFLHTPAGAPHETGEYTHRQQPYGRQVGFDPKYHPDGKLQERQQLLRFKQPAGQGYLVVLYPRLKENDPPATYTRLADNVVKVVTPLSSDVVFVGPHAFTAEVEGIRFTGTSAVVRQYAAGKLTVTNHDGPASLVVAGKTISGTGPFTVTLLAGQAEAKAHGEGATVEVK